MNPNYIDLSTVPDEAIKNEFFRRMRCYQYPEKSVVFLGITPLFLQLLKPIILGAPATSKTQQAQRLTYELCSCLVNPGKLLDKEVKDKTALGQEIKRKVEAGEDISDDLLFEAIGNRITSPLCGRGRVFDGFPKNIEQAQRLDDLLGKSGLSINKVYNFDANDQVIIDRSGVFCWLLFEILNRVARNRSKQAAYEPYGFQNASSPEEMKERLEQYRKITEPVLEHYKGY